MTRIKQLFAVLIVLLAVLPFTAPFQTYDPAPGIATDTRISGSALHLELSSGELPVPGALRLHRKALESASRVAATVQSGNTLNAASGSASVADSGRNVPGAGGTSGITVLRL